VQNPEVDISWSFAELAPSETSYITHGYHRYPAKFIPQLAARIIRENSNPGDLVCDPFMGSGTTLVEAIVNDRRAYGTDINPVSALITRAKTYPLEPNYLKANINRVINDLSPLLAIESKQMHLLTDKTSIGGSFTVVVPSNERIDYWFPERQKHDLAVILSRINAIEDSRLRDFLLCGFSNILKGCSRWLMKSVKPTIDKDKIIADAYQSFLFQMRRMIKKNNEFYKMVGHKQINCVIDNVDARKMNLRDSSVTLIVTSPPYVTSYEYADLHQLTALWLTYTKTMSEFRKKFIGSIQKENGPKQLYSGLGIQTVAKLREIDKREANGVEQYFYEMQQCFEEMHRVLKQGGRLAIVVGDTDLRKVKIQNASVFIETMSSIGFKKCAVILRPIPSKILPLTRDEKTGKFTSTVTADRMAYPTEYIVIMEKMKVKQ
jgi:DNA modification methylase